MKSAASMKNYLTYTKVGLLNSGNTGLAISAKMFRMLSIYDNKVTGYVLKKGTEKKLLKLV